jgi:nicotinamidase/pyrazinamidase
MSRIALGVIDTQEDFCEGGSLAVAGGRKVTAAISTFLAENCDKYDLIFASQDWHNDYPDTNWGHFAKRGTEPDYQKSWPRHCVAYTAGAAFAKEFASLSLVNIIIRKGQGFAAYSAFDGSVAWHNRHSAVPKCIGATLGVILREMAIDELHLVGIAREFCVAETALASPIPVKVYTDLTAAINPLWTPSGPYTENIEWV